MTILQLLQKSKNEKRTIYFKQGKNLFYAEYRKEGNIEYATLYVRNEQGIFEEAILTTIWLASDMIVDLQE